MVDPECTPDSIDALRRVLAAEAPTLLTELGSPKGRTMDRVAWRTAFSTTARQLGRTPLEPELRARIGAETAGWPLTLSEAARGLLLLELEAHPPFEGFPVFVEDLFRTGDTPERVSILRALPLLREPTPLVELAVEACRTSVVTVFEAIACDNPFPRDHFSEPSFNQLVLKAVFLGVPLRRVMGLSMRLGFELRRMARDYAAERAAAGRIVPADLSLLGVSR